MRWALLGPRSGPAVGPRPADAPKAVIKRKGKGKTLRYLVDWEPELDQDGNVTQTWDPTWEKPENIRDDLIDAFEAERTNAL